MKKAFRLALALFAVLLVGLAAVPALALPPPPPPPPTASSHVFHGTVIVGGNPAIDGTLASAHIGSLAWSTTTKSGQYGAEPIFAIPADDAGIPGKDGGENGDTVTFKVSGVEVNNCAFEAGAATTLNLNLAVVVAQITGVTGEVNCDLLGDVTVELFEAGGSTPIASTTSGGGGDYVLPVPAPGTYDVVASKAGFRDEAQANVAVVLGNNDLDFRGETGLIPNAPGVEYVLECVDHWLYAEPPCGLSVSKVLEVVDAWLYGK